MEMVGSLTAAIPDYQEPREPPDCESGRQALETSFHLSTVFSGQSMLIFVFLSLSKGCLLYYWQFSAILPRHGVALLSVPAFEVSACSSEHQNSEPFSDQFNFSVNLFPWIRRNSYHSHFWGLASSACPPSVTPLHHSIFQQMHYFCTMSSLLFSLFLLMLIYVIITLQTQFYNKAFVFNLVSVLTLILRFIAIFQP